MLTSRHQKRQGASSWIPLGAAALAAWAGFWGCTTDNPRETYRKALLSPTPGAGGSVGTGGALTGGTGNTSGSRGGSANTGSSARGGTEGHRGGTGAGDTGGTQARGGTGGTSAHESGGTSSATGGTGAVPDGMGGEGNEPGAAGDTGNPPVEDSCGEPPSSTEPFTRPALRSAAGECATFHYCKFEARAAELDRRIAAHVADPGAATLAAAQAAWREAMSSWSRVELFQFGPLANRADTAGRDNVQGQGIRDLVYSWPLNTRCRAEEQVASQKYKTQGFENVLISSRGLTALEALLFYPGSDTACAPGTATANTFASLDADELTERKLAYLRAVSTDVLANARRLVDAWAPAGGNFKQTWVSASGYADEQQAMTILGWALLYVEREVKDWKLGVPAGFTLNSPVNGPEGVFARVGTDDIVQNLHAFRSIFQGCGPGGEGLGFDDWLVSAGHGDLADDIVHALDAAEAAAAVFPPLDTATPAQIEAFYFTVKALTNLLKSDLFGTGSPLNLKLPMSVQGDTD